MIKLGATILSGLSIILIFGIEESDCALKDAYSWEHLTWKYPNDSVRQSQIEKGIDGRRIVPHAMEIWKNKLFVSLDGYHDTPARVAYINLNDNNKSPELIPYPDWDRSGSKMFNIFNILYVDSCDRLWIIYRGHYLDEDSSQILIYDLKTDKLIRRRVINNPIDPNDFNAAPRNFVVDATKGNCSKTFAYMVRVSGALSVYDFETDDLWEVKLRRDTTHDLDHGCGPIDDLSSWITAAYLTLLPPQTDGYRPLYFTSVEKSGSKQIAESRISTKDLRDKQKSSAEHKFIVLGCRAPIDSSYVTHDEKTGIVFKSITKFKADYKTADWRGIECWNSIKHANEPISEKSGAYALDDGILRIADLKVDENGTMWILEAVDSWIKKPNGTLDAKISTAPVSEAIKGTICDPNASVWTKISNYFKNLG